MEREPLLGRRGSSEFQEETPVQRLRFYWPCLFTGVTLTTLSLCASVWLSKSILDDPTRAAYFQKTWWIVWLVGLLVILGAWRAAQRPAETQIRTRHPLLARPRAACAPTRR